MTTMKKIAVATLGCKVNQFESASFFSTLEASACTLVPFTAAADVYIINTCAVTGRAGQQSRQLIRRAMKSSPGARLVVTGCYAQMAAQEILDITGERACIIGNGNKDLVCAIALGDKSCDLNMIMGNIARQKEVCALPVRRFSDRTRAYLRIQDGCNNFCSYCIVPYTRGRSRSVPLAEVMAQMAVFVEQGYREVVITGINVGKYGLDSAEGQTIYTLLARLCREFSGVRIRLSSVEPAEVTDQLLELMVAAPSFMPHLHIPLQSGDNETLARMNRHYSTELFAAIIHASRAALPQAAIGCDILGGFPGESEAAHQRTLEFLRDLPITYLHVFPYSSRPGTLAASLKNQVPKPVREQRVKELRQLDAQKRREFQQAQIGRVHQVLVERRLEQSDLLQGFSENYLPVCFRGGDEVLQQVVSVRIDALHKGHLRGIMLER